MDEKFLTDLAEKYKEQLQKLDPEGLKMLVGDRAKAIEYAKKGIEQVEPVNLNDDYVEHVADTLQTVAKMILQERLNSSN